MSDKLPQHDLDAEAAVLSALMLVPESIPDVASVLKPSDFYADCNRRVYEAILAIDTDGEKPDAVAVAAHLRTIDRLEQVGGVPYLAQLCDGTPAIANVVQHAKHVVKLSRVRQAVALTRIVQAEADSATAIEDGWIASVEARFYELGRDDSFNETVHTAKELATKETERLSGSGESGGSKTLTGVPPLDRLLGGLNNGCEYIIAGRPGHGKTGLVLQIALNVGCRGEGVHFCSVEMPREQLTLRAISQLSSEDNRDIAACRPHDWAHVHDAIKAFSNATLTVDDKPAPTIGDIRNSIRRGIAKQCKEHGRNVPLRLVVVDYLQLCKNPRAGSREQEISSISAGMAEIAKEFGCAVIALSQLNREIEKRTDREPKLADLRESGAIEQDAFAVIFVHREDQYQSDTSRHSGTADIIVAKVRQGGTTGKETMRYLAACTSFYEQTPEYEQRGDFDNEPGGAQW